MLLGVVKNLNMTLFIGQEWVLQQKSVPAQMDKPTLEWLRRNVLAFISSENWLAGSADLKTLDKNCGLFWRICCAESIITAWIA